MATTHAIGFGIIKIEHSPSPEPMLATSEPTPRLIVATLDPTPTHNSLPIPVDPKDPETFLRRCSGSNKKTKLRCNSVIGQKAQQNCHPTFLPTCRAHRDQQSFAGWCQFQTPVGERCGRLFRWTPPYFELCSEHQGHPDTPCYFFRLPLELRHEIFRYLLPAHPIGSSTASLHNGHTNTWEQAIASPNIFSTGTFHSTINGSGKLAVTRCGPLHQSIFPMSALGLFLVNRRVYQEVKDLLFSTVPFKIDVRKDGTFMCGRRLLEPRRADGSSHFLPDESDEAKQRFLRYFDWSAVKHYAVDILLENWSDQAGTLYPHHSSWDEEVEMYDMRDYISVVVSGVLAKARNLCKLQVRLCLAEFDWPHRQILENTKIILGPFERLRNVRQPQLLGVFRGRPHHNSVLTVQRPPQSWGSLAPVCSVASIPTHNPVMYPGIPDFDEYAADWTRWISSSSASSITSKPPIRNMFTEFKDFYSKLANVVGDVSRRNGRHAFLHRARVAREQEDVKSFRDIRNELIHYWNLYLEQEERKKADMNAGLGRMLDTDTYPSHEWEQASNYTRHRSSSTDATLQSPVLLNYEAMAREGIPMTGNPLKHVLGASQPVSNAQILAQRQMMMAQAQLQKQAQALLMMRMKSQPKKNPLVLPPSTSFITNGDDGADAKPHMNYIKLPPQTSLFRDAEPPEKDSVHVYPLTCVGFDSDWCTTTTGGGGGGSGGGEPGPSTKRRRIDSGFDEITSSNSEQTIPMDHGGVDFGQSYIGKEKGKGKAKAWC